MGTSSLFHAPGEPLTAPARLRDLDRRSGYLVNMAGTSHAGAFGHVTEDDFDALYRVHVKGPFFLTQALLPLLADGGRIVNVSSGLTRIIYPGRIA